MATSLPMSVEVLSLDREHCFRHESEIKKQKKGRQKKGTKITKHGQSRGGGFGGDFVAHTFSKIF